MVVAHSKKPVSGSRFLQRFRPNDYSSYHALGNLLLRARINGLVAWEAIEDSTRPMPWARGWDDREAFIAHEKKIFLWGYERQLMQSQRHHRTRSARLLFGLLPVSFMGLVISSLVKDL